MCYSQFMKNKTFLENIKSVLAGDLEVGKEVKEKQDWIKSQFIELSRLGNCPIVMKMGN